MSTWISVTDRLPKAGQCVDLWGCLAGGHHHGDESRIENCFYNGGRDAWWFWCEAFIDKVYVNGMNVTHWMPLPEPPNVE